MTSENTKNYKKKKKLFLILSICANFLPLVIYIFKGFFGEGVIAQKVGLTTSIMVASIMCFLNYFFKFKIRSILWILILGIHICVDNIIILIILMAICTIIDEFYLYPKYKKYKTKTDVNEAMDERL